MKLTKKAYFLIGILLFGCFAGPVCYYESKLAQCNEAIKEQQEQMALLKVITMNRYLKKKSTRSFIQVLKKNMSI